MCSLTEMDFIKNSLRAALLHINGLLNDGSTTRGINWINRLHYAKTHINKALEELND